MKWARWPACWSLTLRAGARSYRRSTACLPSSTQSPTVLNSTLGRHAARALEAKLVADSMADWILELQPGEPVCAHYQVPESAQGMGLTDAPRGALGHWIQIEEGKIANYQLVVPTTWNASPMDEHGQPGPLEQALIGTKVKDENSPVRVGAHRALL